MAACLGRTGNPSSLHASGRAARRLVEEARETLAAALGARPSEVVFTGGGTEADNLAVKGLYWAAPQRATRRRRRILASAVEHHAVMDAVLWLAEHEGAVVEWLPVDAVGRVHPETFEAAIARRPGVGRAGHRDVGEQRGRHGAAGRRAGRGRPGVRRAVPLRRRPGLRAAAGRLRRERPGRHDRDRPQDRRPARRRRCSCSAATSTWCRCCTAAGRSATSAPARWTPRPSSGSRPPPRLAAKRQPERAERLAGLRDDLVRRVLEVVPDAVLNGDPPVGRPPAARQRPLLVPRLRGRLAAAAARRPRHRVLDRARPARPACRSPATCCSRWACPRTLARGSLRFSLGHTSTAGRRRRPRRGDRPGRRAGPQGRPERHRVTSTLAEPRDR